MLKNMCRKNKSMFENIRKKNQLDVYKFNFKYKNSLCMNPCF